MEKTMKAVVYKGNGVVSLEERPIPVILKDTDAIVRVTRSTICSSDIHIKHGQCQSKIEYDFRSRICGRSG